MKLRLIHCLFAVLIFLCGSLANAATVGQPAPPFSLKDDAGNTVSLNDYLGSGVILDFCAIWCAACQNFYSSGTAALVPGSELVVSVLLEDGNLAAADQGDALAWNNAFSVDSVLHVSGSQVEHDAIIIDYLGEQLPAFALPTFVFVDANLNVVGNFIGAPNVNDAQWAGYVEAIELSQVPVPAAMWLFGSSLGLLGWLRRKTD